MKRSDARNLPLSACLLLQKKYHQGVAILRVHALTLPPLSLFALTKADKESVFMKEEKFQS